MENGETTGYVSRGGEKLVAALQHFRVDVAGWVCADFGSHVGGFVDCLLQRGAARVYSVDTSYGTLAWKLRKDVRVRVLERSNAMHVALPEKVSLLTVDVGWTRQERVLPNAAAQIADDGLVISLIKPHYEAREEMLIDGVLPEDRYAEVVEQVLGGVRSQGWTVAGTVESALRGHGGNRELFALLRRS